ncbi:energy-coupled thiamine transporter ThiT [Serpentinicella alkaliphila]|uniref:Thiamine transporter n=1 Tax=Serpentinicella alkaliphila TaxID=1734049 RepID=A0A4R2TPQ2_9FIRM|nr:energy-coupled thiamine transporter ThiT [Serpentinicella alkaliphila]TCQ03285.1 thiamine transporter [Serpentinicella alkaliphila]
MFKEFQRLLAEGDLQGIISSILGQIMIGILALIILFIAVTRGRDKNRRMRIRVLTYSALAIAASLALSQIKFIQMPQGGSLTPFSMLFIIAIGYFFGLKSGLMVGTVYGLVQLVLGGWVMHPIQLLLDYPLAFGALGLSGIFANHKYGLAKGILIGSLGRFICHFLSGIIFFASYAPEGWNPVVYSAWYNFSYVGVEGIASALLVSIPAVRKAFNIVKNNASLSYY